MRQRLRKQGHSNLERSSVVYQGRVCQSCRKVEVPQAVLLVSQETATHEALKNINEVTDELAAELPPPDSPVQ